MVDTVAINKQFVRDIEDFIDLANSNMDTIYKEAVIEVAEIASTPISQGGRMPVITGDLRNSICASSNVGLSAGLVTYRSAILNSTALSPVFFGWTVPYAEYVEFGLGNNIPRAFARSAANNFDVIVDRIAARVNP